MRHCGLDFGTSNSTVGVVDNGSARLLPLEGTKTAIPSAVFFGFEDGRTRFGRQAITEYIDGAEGRLMRALKSVLGSSLIHETTRIRARQVKFTDILGIFIAHLKAQAEHQLGAAIDAAVVGRPVHFVDDDPAADQEAEHQLEKAVRARGFRHVHFQFEPIAAALDYEQRVTREELALIVDIGGGTSDFSVVRVSPQRAKAADREQDILANTGVHLGGTDFDRLLSMAKVMPHLGYRTLTKTGKLEVPSGYYFDLATWQRINLLYTREIMTELKQVRYVARHPELIDRLIGVVESRQGHSLATKVEEAKIALTETPETTLDLGLLQGRLAVRATRRELNKALADAVQRITATVAKTLELAAVTAADIQALFLTGGSTQIPVVKKSILKMFPDAPVIEGDMFGSVGLGLALDARRKFG